jgi:CheY-like chemotaxis protein
MAPLVNPSPRPLPLVLIAEADADTLMMYADNLRLAGWSVIEASDGRDALAMALNRRPDLIISASRLPGISGHELCGLLRRDLATRHTPITLLASEGLGRELERARSVGASSVLVKPCVPDVVRQEAVRLLAEAQSLQDQAGGGGLAPTSLSTTIAQADGSSRPRRSLSRAHQRGPTELPPSTPPELICPSCDRALDYKSSQVGGVSARNAEQWDYFECVGGCGAFQYRHRTRKLRKV